MVSEQDRQQVIAAGQRRLKLPPGRPPLVLSHDQIRRMLDRKPSVLILARSLGTGPYKVHDEQTIQSNLRNVRRQRSDLQEDPAVFMIEITGDPTRILLSQLELTTVRAAGYKTLEDFYYEEWLWRSRRFVPTVEISIYPYELASAARYLHQKVHRGYTHDPAEAVPDEPEAVDDNVLLQFAEDNRTRYTASHADEVRHREARSLTRRLRAAQEAAALADKDITPEITAIQRQLDQIQAKLGKAA